jgi:hypothetical protein
MARISSSNWAGGRPSRPPAPWSGFPFTAASSDLRIVRADEPRQCVHLGVQGRAALAVMLTQVRGRRPS